MKKTLSRTLSALLAVIMIAACFSFYVSAADPVVLLGTKVTDGKHRLTVEETTEDGVSCVKILPAEELATPKLDKYNVNADATVYKYAKVIYKTNFSNSMEFNFLSEVACNYILPVTTVNEWTGVVFELKAAEEGKKLKQYHFSCFGNYGGIALKESGAEMFIHSVSFFETNILIGSSIFNLFIITNNGGIKIGINAICTGIKF